MDLCNGMKTKLLGKMDSALNLSSLNLSSELSKLSSLSMSPNIDMSGLNKLDSLLDQSDLFDGIQSIAGSCLDGILDEVPVLSLSDLIPSNMQVGLGDLSGLMEGLMNIDDLFGSLGLGELVGKVDSLLGCLSSSGCNITGDVMDKIGSFENSFVGFTENGLDVEEYLESTNLGNMAGKIKDLKKKLKKKLNKNITKLDYKYY